MPQPAVRRHDPVIGTDTHIPLPVPSPDPVPTRSMS
jgi:hypothetical protein